jgi:hypothetical protein
VSQNFTDATAAAMERNANINGDVLLREVQALIDGTAPLASDPRRARDRFPIGYAFQLAPIVDDRNLMNDETITVFGKNLSVAGICFSHDVRLACRRAVISLTDPAVGRFAVEAEIVWTRVAPIGLFETGCRLVRTVAGHNLRSLGPEYGG